MCILVGEGFGALSILNTGVLFHLIWNNVFLLFVGPVISKLLYKDLITFTAPESGDKTPASLSSILS